MLSFTKLQEAAESSIASGVEPFQAYYDAALAAGLHPNECSQVAQCATTPDDDEDEY